MKIFSLIFALILNIQLAKSQLLDDVKYCLEGKTTAFQKAINNRIAKNNRYPGDAKIDVNYYKLELALDVTYQYLPASPNTVSYINKNVNGITTIKAKALENNLTSVKIDLQNTLIADSIFVDNKKTTFTHSTAIIDIALTKTYGLNEQFTLKIYYHGTPGSSGFGSFTFGTHNNTTGMKQEPAIWSLSEPFGASDWFPCKDNPSDKADSSDVWITAPKYFTSVSNGILETKIENATTNTFKWKSRYPIANYLISIALANYDYYKNDFNHDGPSPMPVDHFIYPEYNTASNRLLMDDTVFMLDLFSDKFGAYPFLKERYGHAMFGWGGGMEHQTCSSMVNMSSGLTAHELAHQWFGDKITCQDWANIWLNEGFATFGALIYWEAKINRADYNAKIISTMNSAKTAVGTVYVQNPTTVGNIFNGARSYSKGGIILHMLRNIMGDTKFYNGLKAYTSSIHAYGNATTEGFQAIMEAIGGEDLDYFFNQWVYGEKYPKYQFGWGVFPNPNGKKDAAAGYTLKFKITQLINTPQPSYFTMPVDLLVTFTDNTTEKIRVFNNAQDQYFEQNFSKNITSVSFDPENGILKDLTLVDLNLPLSLEETSSPIALANEKFAKFIAFEVNPNPVSNYLKVSLLNKKINHYTLEIKTTTGIKIGEYVLENKNEKLETSIDLSNFTSGQYQVHFTSNGYTLSKKIIVTH